MTAEHDNSEGRIKSFFGFTHQREAQSLEAVEQAIADPPPLFGTPRRRSDRVAQIEAEAEARWEALENDLKAAKQQVEELRAENAVVKQANAMIKREAAALKQDNERLVRENTAVAERVRIAAEVLITLQKPVVSNESSFDAGGAETGRMTNDMPNFTDVERKQPANWPTPPSKEKHNV